MSGGYFNYLSSSLTNAAEEIQDIIDSNESEALNSWGDKIGREYNQEVIKQFQEAVRILSLASIYERRVDWLLSNDDSEEFFLKKLKREVDKFNFMEQEVKMPELVFQKTDDCPDVVQLPEYKTFLAAAFDLQASKNTTILPNSKEVIGTGLRVLIPRGYYARIESRSGLSAKFSIEKGAGIIDADYCDEWKIILHNHSSRPFHVVAGDRVAQAIIAPCVQACLKWGTVPDKHPESNRTGGLGSTGV